MIIEGKSTLAEYLSGWALEGQKRSAVCQTILALAESSIEMSELVARGPLAGRFGQSTPRAGGFDDQKHIDVVANASLLAALKSAPVAAFASEEMDEPVDLAADAPLLVAADPLDGSSNVEANVSFGMIFAILPRHPASTGAPAFLRPGSHQLASGFFLYGPNTSLVLTVGNGTLIFTLDRAARTYVATNAKVAIPAATEEYAINASNARFWDEPIRIYVHDLENGADGPRGQNFNMRWTGSPVADIFRILTRGGIYLYPGDSRKGFHHGRIRLIYEACPLAFLIEQAGGRATSGHERLLDVLPTLLHQKTPLICGARDEVDRVSRMYTGCDLKGERSALFGRRGLFRAT